MKIRLLESVKPLGGPRIPEGTIVEVRPECDGFMTIVDRPGWCALNPWEWTWLEEGKD